MAHAVKRQHGNEDCSGSARSCQRRNAGLQPCETREAAMTDFFPGFEQRRIATSGAEINLMTGGRGPPLLLLHGYPQTHLLWRKIAPRLAEEFTLVIPDLRGYGDSSKPPSGSDQAAYAKGALAQ